MRGRTWIAAATAAGVITSIGLVASAVTNASADPSLHPPLGVVATNVGTVTYAATTGSTTASVTWTPLVNGTPGTPVLEQTISSSGQCGYSSALATNASQVFTPSTPSSTPEFATGANPSTAAPGFNGQKLNLGVLEKGNTSGTSCSFVDQQYGESLALRVASPSSSSDVFPSRVYSMHLDVNLAGNAVIIADLMQGGPNGTRVGQAELQSGFNASPAPLPNAWTQVYNCQAGVSNSGPQTGSKNNCWWPISNIGPTPSTCSTTNITNYTFGAAGGPCGLGAPSGASAATGALDWDTVVLTPLNPSGAQNKASFSIQGGQSYDPGTDGPTSFDLRSTPNRADCYTSDSLPSSPGFTGNFASFTFTRINDGAGSGTSGTNCPIKGYSASIDGNGNTATLIATGDPYAQWLLQIERDYPAGVTPTQLVIDWTNTATATAGGTVIPLCTGPNFTASSTSWSNLVPLDTTASPNTPAYWSYLTTGPIPPTVNYAGLPDMYPTTTSTKDYVCIYGQSLEEDQNATGASIVKTIDWVYLAGDARLMG